jgi:hypothetical protein
MKTQMIFNSENSENSENSDSKYGKLFKSITYKKFCTNNSPLIYSPLILK